MKPPLLAFCLHAGAQPCTELGVSKVGPLHGCARRLHVTPATTLQTEPHARNCCHRLYHDYRLRSRAYGMVGTARNRRRRECPRTSVCCFEKPRNNQNHIVKFTAAPMPATLEAVLSTSELILHLPDERSKRFCRLSPGTCDGVLELLMAMQRCLLSFCERVSVVEARRPAGLMTSLSWS